MLLTSCFKEDERIVPSRPGNLTTKVIELMPDYRLQVYFDLNTGEEVSSNLKTVWDLGLTCTADDYKMMLNTSQFIKVAHTESDNFDIAYSTEGFVWVFDESTGNFSGNAIGKWWEDTEAGPVSLNEVMLIDRGIDADGLPAGYFKMQLMIDAVTKVVSVRLAELDGSSERQFSFIKDPTRRFVTLSFENGFNAMQPEPAATTWDLLFTQYTTLLYTDTGEPYPYLVTGVLINDTLVKAVMDSITPFDNVTRELAESLILSTRQDVIGYDWKKVNGDVTSGNVTYTAIPDMVFIIKNKDGYFFKLRFIDFYNNLGQKGYPTFEYQKL